MNRILNLKQIKQKTNEWYKIRKKIITATDVSTILECNRFETKKQLLEKKIKNQEIFSNSATEWGNFFEDIAISIYSSINNVKIIEVGLLIHEKYKWLGASPDGIMCNNKLIEIKCPYSRKIFNQVPINYWIQTQIQMEVCDIDETILFICAFEQEKLNNGLKYGVKDNIDWSLTNCKEFVIKRDKKWFEKNLQRMKSFHSDLEYFQKNGLNINKRKRGNGINHDIHHKKLKTEYQDWNQWNNISNLTNYFNNDLILDWLNLYGKELYPKDKKSISQKFIEDKSKEFKKNVINYIKNNFPNDFIEITNQPDNYLKSNFYFNETINSLQKFPVIINGIIHNKDLKIYSKVDLILNKEIYEKITGKKLIDHDLIFIKIEYCTINFLKNFDFINSNLYQRNYNYVLNQVFNEYNFKSVGGLLGYKSNRSNNCFHSIGIIKHENKKLNLALEWIDKLKKSGKLWSINPPTVVELYPNMKNYNDYPWNNTKKIIAVQNNEISLLTNCTLKQRNELHQNNIFKLEDINNTTFNSPILETNFYSNQIFSPNKIEKNHNNWKYTTNELYIDFETVNDLDENFLTFPHHNSKNIIFMIGIGHNINGEWKYYNLTVDRIDLESEDNILNQLQILLNTLDYDIIYHWSNAEINFLNNYNLKHHTNYNLPKNFDLLKLFRNEPITIKGLFDYKLKNVVKTMNNHKMINIKWDDISNGLDAMVLTWKYNKVACCKNMKLSQIKGFKSIIDYNHVDCKSMFEIIKYLKNNHI
jgi:putative phage-type endonuclease